VAALEVLLCGRWFLLTLCGACGAIEMIETLRTKKGCLRSSEPFFFFFFFILCSLGLLRS
jgi:hypothetical protein